ncbi:MAG TPA: hypothetical protein VF628_11075 [Allosphingosinicella sp.]|jgi:hypothetical protein
MTLATELLELAQAIGSDMKTALAGSGGSSNFALITKGSDAGRSSATTFLTDSALKVTLGIGRWVLRLKVRVVSGAAITSGFKYQTLFTGTTSAVRFDRTHVAAGAAAGTDSANTAQGTTQVPSTSLPHVAANSAGWVAIDIELIVTASGEFQFQWGPNSAASDVTTVGFGSTLEYKQVG